MSFIESLFHLESLLASPKPECLALSMADVHAPGLFSLVIDGTEPGELTRCFIATKKLKPFDVQLHTHRYSLELVHLKGRMEHHTAEIDYGFNDAVDLDLFDYKSFLLGGDGLKFRDSVLARIKSHGMPIGGGVSLGAEQFHTISCEKGAIWVVNELGFESESSQVLGVPFVADGLYNKPGQFQVNDMCQIVLGEVRKLLKVYGSLKAGEHA